MTSGQGGDDPRRQWTAEVEVTPELAAELIGQQFPDLAIDLSIAFFAFDGPAREYLLTAYGRPVSADQELAARTCALSLAASLAEYAADNGRASLLRASLAGIRRSVGA